MSRKPILVSISKQRDLVECIQVSASAACIEMYNLRLSTIKFVWSDIQNTVREMEFIQYITSAINNCIAYKPLLVKIFYALKVFQHTTTGNTL